MADDCGAADLATSLMGTLTAGVDFSVPDIDLSGAEYQLPTIGSLDDTVSRLTNADLTTGAVDGTGTFDVLMKGLRAQLQVEFEKGRLTGEQFSKVYTELTAGAMQNAVQFLLGRDTSYWQAIVAQQQALAAQVNVVTERVKLQIAKVQLQALQFETLTNKANYALTEMKLATESIGFCTAKYNLDNILPAQKLLVSEQTEAQRAQTMDTRMDGVTPVFGIIGKQKDLYAQQIVSYKRDSEVKAAKLFTDAWITQKTIDEGLLAPNGFTNTSLDTILTALKINNELT